MVRVDLRTLRNVSNRLYRNGLVYKSLLNYVNKKIRLYKDLIASKATTKIQRKKKKDKRAKLGMQLNNIAVMLVAYQDIPREGQKVLKCKNMKCVRGMVNFYDKVNEIEIKLRRSRVVRRDGIINQKPIVEDIKKPYHYLMAIPDVSFLSRNFDIFVKKANNALYEDENIISASIQFLYGVDGGDNNINVRHTKAMPFLKGQEEYDMRIDSEQSDIRVILLGYRIILLTRNNEINETTYEHLRAYHPSSNRKFHELCTASTPLNRLCIYTTFLDVIGKRKLIHKRDNKKNRDIIKSMLKAEGKEIEKSVKGGKLVESLKLLTKKYKKKTMVVFFNSQIRRIKDKLIMDETPIIIDNGSVIESTDKGILEFLGKTVFLYEKNIHVAPYIFRLNCSKRVERIKKKIKKQYVLRKMTIKTKHPKKCAILGYDCETYLDENNDSVVFCICLYGFIGNYKIKRTFYSAGDKNAVQKFIKYIKKISTPVNNKKSRPKNSIRQIYIYGFNNSNFDNIFIYEGLYRLDPETKFIFTGNSIKYMKYNNISFYDISLYYKMGGLRETAKEFELEKEKGVYPYEFPNKNNLKYIGTVPDVKYWNSEEERTEYINKNGYNFDLRRYTKKYCMLDSELVYLMAKKHITSCTGEINGRLYNIMNAPTSANLALKMFQQAFQKDDLKQSPDNIIEFEKEAYKGGRTEPFIKEFKSDGKKELYYYDINSSYPSGMTELMPSRYKMCVDMDVTRKVKLDEIVDYNIYVCRSEYANNNKRIIPNLLTRTKKGNIIATKNTKFSSHWGKEIKEAIKNGFDIYCKKAIVYEGKKIFDVFANYFYTKRLEMKYTNKALSLFYKTVMNSLYGKFGQRSFNKTKLISDIHDLNGILNSDMTKLINLKVVGNIKLIEYKTCEQEYTSIGKLMRFASYISSTSRCKLSEFMRDVGHENVYYCDTDSVFTSNKPSAHFIDQNILGKWKLECKPIKRAVFLAPKMYCYETIDGKNDKKAKGINKNNMLKLNDYETMLQDENTKISRKSKMFFRTLENIKIEDQIRRVTPVFNKRIWKGTTSYPYNKIEDWNKDILRASKKKK